MRSENSLNEKLQFQELRFFIWLDLWTGPGTRQQQQMARAEQADLHVFASKLTWKQRSWHFDKTWQQKFLFIIEHRLRNAFRWQNSRGRSLTFTILWKSSLIFIFTFPLNLFRTWYIPLLRVTSSRPKPFFGTWTTKLFSFVDSLASSIAFQHELNI